LDLDLSANISYWLSDKNSYRYRPKLSYWCIPTKNCMVRVIKSYVDDQYAQQGVSV